MTPKTQNSASYQPIITHDIDRFYKWKNSKSIIGEIGRIIRGKSSWTYNEAWKSFKNRNQADPFSNLLEIAQMDREAGLPSIFYIMTTEEKHPLNINDYNVNDSKVSNTLKELIALGCEIGIHPGIYTFNDREKMEDQKSRLEEVIDQPVKRSRQHYLKYEYPETFKNLELIGIENDSSIMVELAHVEDPRKRSTYLMFDDLGSKLTQTPLVFMDTHHMKDSDELILSNLEESIAPAKENGGEIMILWHNNNISNNREVGLYREALEVIKK